MRGNRLHKRLRDMRFALGIRQLRQMLLKVPVIAFLAAERTDTEHSRGEVFQQASFPGPPYFAAAALRAEGRPAPQELIHNRPAEWRATRGRGAQRYTTPQPNTSENRAFTRNFPQDFACAARCPRDPLSEPVPLPPRAAPRHRTQASRTVRLLPRRAD